MAIEKQRISAINNYRYYGDGFLHDISGGYFKYFSGKHLLQKNSKNVKSTLFY